MRRRRRRGVETTDGPTRIEQRTGAKTSRTEAKTNLTLAKAKKAEMVASKRRWLVFLIGIAMSAYMLFKLKIGVG